MFPMMLPLAREGPPVQGREGRKEEKKKKGPCENSTVWYFGGEKIEKYCPAF